MKENAIVDDEVSFDCKRKRRDKNAMFSSIQFSGSNK